MRDKIFTYFEAELPALNSSVHCAYEIIINKFHWNKGKMQPHLYPSYNQPLSLYCCSYFSKMIFLDFISVGLMLTEMPMQIAA